MVMNLIIPIVQIIGGVLAGSMALISDALHNFGDFTATLISYIALRNGERPATSRLTFGYKRVAPQRARPRSNHPTRGNRCAQDEPDTKIGVAVEYTPMNRVRNKRSDDADKYHSKDNIPGMSYLPEEFLQVRRNDHDKYHEKQQRDDRFFKARCRMGQEETEYQSQKYGKDHPIRHVFSEYPAECSKRHPVSLSLHDQPSR